ncbi:MAG: nicotinate (nicotinamide) nucleotide adenylyltransferase [Burkholderiaceae bacterium]|nr:nicotinate (nicotinamide) nucleotide adenylyltransferase [Burkholderiaceae bacterium]
MGVEKIGLLGGSFDPVHLTHIALAEAAWRTLGLSQVQLIPAASPWQRHALAASGKHRLAMLDLAIGDRAWLQVNPIEVQRGGATYTIDTIRQLPPGHEYYWILGSDQLQNFCSWHRWEEIARRVCLAVALRPGSAILAPQALQELLSRQGRSLITLPFTPSGISATAIRQQLALGKSTDGLLDVAVAQYIQQNALYQAPVA